MLKSILNAFDLTEYELKQNRAGKLSTDQRLRLLKKLVEFAGTIVVLGIVAVGVFEIGKPPNVQLASIILLLCVAICLERGFRFTMALLDLVRSDTKQYEDRIQLVPISRTSAQLEIGKMNFKITALQLLALRNGLRYIVYYTPRSRMLASIEPSHITEGDPSVDDLSYDLIPSKEKRTFRLGEDGELIADQDPQVAHKSKES
jgi:hypothetical protein